MLDTKARRLLEAALEAHTQVNLAAQLGIGQSAVSHWVRGLRRPEAHHRLALRLLFGIPQSAWMTDDELALVARIRALVKSRKEHEREAAAAA